MDYFEPVTDEALAKVEASHLEDVSGRRRVYADSVSTSEKIRARVLNSMFGDVLTNSFVTPPMYFNGHSDLSTD